MVLWLHGAKAVLTAACDQYACREFTQLIEANKVAQLPESEFEVDPGLRDIIEAQIRQEEEAVRQVGDALSLCPARWLLWAILLLIQKHRLAFCSTSLQQ